MLLPLIWKVKPFWWCDGGLLQHHRKTLEFLFLPRLTETRVFFIKNFFLETEKMIRNREKKWKFVAIWSTMVHSTGSGTFLHMAPWDQSILSPTENFFLLLQSQDWITRQIKIFGSSKKRGKTQQRILSDCHGCRILTWKPSLPVYLFKKVPIEYF